MTRRVHCAASVAANWQHRQTGRPTSGHNVWSHLVRSADWLPVDYRTRQSVVSLPARHRLLLILPTATVYNLFLLVLSDLRFVYMSIRLPIRFVLSKNNRKPVFYVDFSVRKYCTTLHNIRFIQFFNVSLIILQFLYSYQCNHPVAVYLF